MSIKEVSELKEELKGREEHLESVGNPRFLFLDVSSTCTGYSLVEIDFSTRKVKVLRTGVLWFNNNWSDQEKYSYLFSALVNYFWIVEQVDYIVHESYSVNPSRMMGVLVVPEMIGAVKVAAWENGVKVDSIPPQTWRKHLGVKPDITPGKDGKNKKDYKEPTKRKILELVDIPEKVISNITGQERQTPSDLYDSLGVMIGWVMGLKWKDEIPFLTNGIKDISFKEMKINAHVGYPIGK